jgi:hypothetical protein
VFRLFWLRFERVFTVALNRLTDFGEMVFFICSERTLVNPVEFDTITGS